MTDERPMPSNVIQAIARVMEEMPAVGKDAQYSGGGSGSYSYRSIEAVTAAAQKLMGRYGVVPVPRVISRKTVDITVNGKPWTQDELEIVYRFFGPGGLEDYVDVGPMWGLGRDNSDKGTNKASTQAYKVALIQLLCIGDSRHDADSERAETDARQEVDPEAWFKEHGWRDRKNHDDERHAFALRVKESHEIVRASFRAWFDDQGIEWAAAWPANFFEQVEKRFETILVERTVEPDDQPESPNPTLGPGSPVHAPLSASEAESVGNALVEHLRGMNRAALLDAFSTRGLPVKGDPTDDRLRQKLGAVMLGEGWRPAQLTLGTEKEPVCLWCCIGRTDTNELVEYPEALLHSECYEAFKADKETDSGRPF